MIYSGILAGGIGSRMRNVPWKIVESFDDLILALDNKDYQVEKVVPFLDKHFKYHDGRSSERVVRNIFGS